MNWLRWICRWRGKHAWSGRNTINYECGCGLTLTTYHQRCHVCSVNKVGIPK